jgi:hypothetical protein
MKGYNRRLLNVLIFLVIFLGLPLLFKEGPLLMFSWIPAAWAVDYLDKAN